MYATLVGIARALLLHDQVDGRNMLGAELLFRRLQMVEYSYSDRLRDRAANSTGAA